MAKNSVTENDLISGAGGFDAFNRLSTGKPIRDNPFRDTRAVEPRPSDSNPEPVLARSVVVESVTTESIARPVQPAAPTTQQAVVAPRKIEVGRQPPPVTVSPVRPEVGASEVVRPAAAKAKKSELYPEKVNAFLSGDMVEDLLMESRKLNSRRLVKGDAISSNTLIRCGVRVVTKLIQFSDTDVVSSEEELYALIKKKLKS